VQPEIVVRSCMRMSRSRPRWREVAAAVIDAAEDLLG
jgi:hypothetical protein